MKKAPRFVKLFENETSDPSYPYYAGTKESPRIVPRMPNTILSMSLGRRAAKALLRRLQTREPEKYQSFRWFLMRLLLDCTDVEQEWQKLENSFRATDSETFKKWEKIFQHVKRPFPEDRSLTNGPRDRMNEQRRLCLLHFMGIPPGQIILTKPSNFDQLLQSTTGYTENFVTRDPMRDGVIVSYEESKGTNYSPLEFPLGDGTTVSSNLAYFLSNELKSPLLLKHRRPVTNVVKDYGLKNEEGDILNSLSPGAEWGKDDKKKVCAELRGESFKGLGITETDFKRHISPLGSESTHQPPK